MMKKRMIRALAAFLVALMAFSAIPSAAYAVGEQALKDTAPSGGIWINPLEEGIPDLAVKPVPIPSAELNSSEENVLTTEEAVASVRQHFVNRDASFSVTVETPDVDLNDYTWYLIRHAMDHTGVPDEGDYIYSQFRTINWDSSENEGLLTVAISATYRSTRAQENKVDQKVAQILNELQVPRENDYETFSAVYDYLTEHVVYNKSGASHTAYGALVNNQAVCQGFAAALYRLCLEAGIDCRYCVSKAQNHAWNIVGLGGEYYLTDSTWDRKKDETAFYRYCLNGTEDWMTRHIASNNSLTTIGDQFYSAKDPYGQMEAAWFDPVEQYPLSAVNFEEGRHQLTVEYVYPDGTQAAQPYRQMVWACERYSVPVPSIAGYTMSCSEVSGIMAGHDLAITVEYVPEGHVHSWDGGTVTTAATCTDPGIKTYTCSCGAERTETIAAAGHRYSGSTCTVCGLQVTAKGTIRGGSALWTFENNGRLTVFGTGHMGVLSSLDLVPWNAYLEDITSVEIKEGITSVCTLAFDGCVNLSSVSLPGSLIAIENKAFHGCTSLTEIELPDSVQLVDKNAFLNAGLTSLALGKGAYYFGPDCFAGNEGLAEVTYAGSLERWCYADVKNEYGNPGWCASSFTIDGEELTGEIEIPAPVRNVRPYTFVNRDLSSVTFPDTLEQIGEMAFSGNTGIEKLVFTGNCPKAGTSVIGNVSFDLHYPCANDSWNEGSMAELCGEEHMPGCTVETCMDHLWDGGIEVQVDGHPVIRYTCQRCGATLDESCVAETCEIELNVIWKDADDQDGIRPGKVTVNVVGKLDNGTVAVQPFAVVITAGEGWAKTVSGLEKYDPDDQLITYSIRSENKLSGYITSVSGLSVSNTHIPARTTVRLEQFWVDENDRKGLRPEAVYVTLVGTVGDKPVYKCEYKITERDGWVALISGLDKNAFGKPVSYSIVDECPVDGYVTSIDGTTAVNVLDGITTSDIVLEAKRAACGIELCWSMEAEGSAPVFEIYRREIGGDPRLSASKNVKTVGRYKWELIAITEDPFYSDGKVAASTVYEYQIRVSKGEIQGISNVVEITSGLFMIAPPFRK